MLKDWKTLSNVDVSKFVEQREDEKGNVFDYIPWVKMMRLLHDNGAEKVRMGIIPSANGNTVHMTEVGFTDKNGAVNHCPEVHVWVEIDGERYEYVYPVISGSYVVKDATLNQQRIATAVIRAQCKCIAINTGLGISLWEKNDEVEAKPGVDIISMQSASNLFKKFGQSVSELMRDYDLTEAEIAHKMGIDSERVGDILRVTINQLASYEKALEKIKKDAAK